MSGPHKAASILIFLLILIQSAKISFAQTDSIQNMKPKQMAFYYACHLKSGALLVRLKSRVKTIEKLKLMGDFKSAEKIRLQQLEENKFIIRCFQKEFNFCPVYFFYNTSNDSVLQNHLNNIFLDSSAELNSSVKLKEKFFLVAEEGDIEIGNQGTYSDSTVTNPVLTYTIRSGGIRMMDNQFHLLTDPFPYFTNYGDFDELAKTVSKLNKHLLQLCPN